MSFEFRTEIVPSQLDSRYWAMGQHTDHLSMVGNGLYSQVFTSFDTPFVIKIGGGHDTGYLSYLRTIQSLNITNRFLPRIFEAIYYQSEDNIDLAVCDRRPCKDTFVVKMEKLKPGRREQGRNKTLFEKAVLFVAESIRGYNTEKKLSPELVEAITLVQLANELAQKEMDSTCDRFDLHTGNFMLRNGRIVITDPLA